VVPERCSGKDFGAFTAFRQLSCNQGGMLLLQRSGKYLPQNQIYSAPPDPLAGFKGPTSKGREEKE